MFFGVSLVCRGGMLRVLEAYVTDLWGAGHGFAGRRSRILDADVTDFGVTDLQRNCWFWAQR